MNGVFEPRIGEPMVQVIVICQEKQTLAVEIESTDRIYAAREGTKILKRFLPATSVNWHKMPYGLKKRK